MSIATKRKRKCAKTRSITKKRNKKTKHRRCGKTKHSRGYKKFCRGGGGKNDAMNVVKETGGDDVFTFDSININPISFTEKINEALTMFIVPLTYNNTNINTTEIRIYNIDDETSQYTHGIKVLCNGLEYNHYTCEFNEHKMNIESVERCFDIMSGTDLIIALIKFADHIGIQESILTDVAIISIDEKNGNENPTEIDLGLYSIMLKGYTWYEQYGFVPYGINMDAVNKKREFFRNLTFNQLNYNVNNADFDGTEFKKLLIGSTPANILIQYLENVNRTIDWNRYTLANIMKFVDEIIKKYNNTNMDEIDDNSKFIYENAVKVVNLIIFIAGLIKFGLKPFSMVRKRWNNRNTDGTFVMNSN